MMAERASMMFMILLYHSLAKKNRSSANAADKQGKGQAVENVLFGHSVCSS